MSYLDVVRVQTSRVFVHVLAQVGMLGKKQDKKGSKESIPTCYRECSCTNTLHIFTEKQFEDNVRSLAAVMQHNLLLQMYNFPSP